MRGAAGWDGDRYQVVAVDGEQVLNWLTVWDSADEAREFAAAVARFSAPTGRRWVAEVTTLDGRPVVLVEQRPLRLAGPPLIDLARVAFDAP